MSIEDFIRSFNPLQITGGIFVFLAICVLAYQETIGYSVNLSSIMVGFVIGATVFIILGNNDNQ